MDKFKAILGDLYADLSDGLEDNPRGMAIAFAIGVFVCGVAVIVF